MKIKSNRQQLLKALSLGLSTASEATVIPAHSCFLIKATEFLNITAANPHSEISTDFTTEILQEGSAIIPARKLYDTISLIDSEDVEMNVTESKCVIKADRKRYTISCYADRGFPRIEAKGEIKGSFSMFFTDLKNQLNAAVKFVSRKDDLRLSITGVNATANEEGVTFVSTDTSALYKGTVFNPNSGNCSFLLHQISVSTVNQLDSIEQCKVSVYDTCVEIKCGASVIKMLPIASKYPDISPIVSRQGESSFTVLKKDLLSALRGSLVHGGDNTIIRVELEDNEMKCTSEGNVSSSEEVYPAEIVGKKTFCANAKIIKKCVDCFSSDNLTIFYGSAYSTPFFMYAMNGSDIVPGTVAVFMPINI